MSPEHENLLLANYPQLYRQDRGFGGNFGLFEFGNGWLAIIEDLSASLAEMIAEQPVAKRKCLYIVEAKSKLGRLRVYMYGDLTSEMLAAIAQAELRSGQVCEVCGKPGKIIRHQGIITTDCPEHDRSAQ